MRIARFVISGLLLVAVVILIWPAAWGGIFSFAIVSGTSMQPTYHTGDVVLAMKRGAYEPGDVIVYTVDQDGQTGRVVHRIVEQLPNGNYITNGDNKPATDPWEVKPDWINGEVVQVLPQAAQVLLIIRSPVFLAIICGLLVTAALWPRAKKDDEVGSPPGAGDAGAEPSSEPSNGNVVALPDASTKHPVD